METKNLKFNDFISPKDMISNRKVKHQGFNTRVECRDEFGNVMFTAPNQTVLGGALFVLEKLFNIRATLTIDTINNIMDINAADSNKSGNYQYDDIVSIWGIGIGGSGEAFGSVRDVKFYEREIAQNGQGASEMVPFRMTSVPLEGTEADKYSLRKEIDGHYAYYAKGFEIDPFIKALWKDGEEGEDGTEVTDDVYTSEREDEIEVFVELHLKINKKEAREWFEYNGEIEKARVNSIGLMYGRKYEVETGRFDHTNVKLFSKLNFDNEPMSNNKELNFTYRIFVD